LSFSVKVVHKNPVLEAKKQELWMSLGVSSGGGIAFHVF
jgi:hypothetical protein